MTKTIEIDIAQTTFNELVASLGPDDEVVIVQNDKPVARLIAPAPARQPRQAGNCKGMITILSKDDDHLKDFSEYMP